MDENRRHFRLREFIDVAWKLVGNQEVSGEGLVVNISSSGLFLQTDRVFIPSDDCVMSIESRSEDLPFAPKMGKIMWLRKIHTPQERFQIGIEFLADQIDNGLQKWLEKKVDQLREAENATILGNLAL